MLSVPVSGADVRGGLRRCLGSVVPALGITYFPGHVGECENFEKDVPVLYSGSFNPGLLFFVGSSGSATDTHEVDNGF